VVVNPIVSYKPCFNQNPNPIEREIPGLYPACAVTRTMSRKSLEKVVDENDDEINSADTCVGQALEDGCNNDLVESKSFEDVVPNSSLSDQADELSTSQLIAEQNKDPEISCLIQKAVDA
jgi:hypothetical protein